MTDTTPLQESIKRVASQHPELQDIADKLLEKIAAGGEFGEVEELLKTSRKQATDYVAYMKKLTAIAEGLKGLVNLAENPRQQRAGSVQVSNLKFDGKVITGKTQSKGKSSSYETRITLMPKRGFNCSCPDREYNSKKKGPCKHVIALGAHFWTNELRPEVEKLDKAMESVTSKMTLIS